MGKISAKHLIEQVRLEAANILEHATEEERKCLNIMRLDAYDTRQCIYGQMTGDCYNDRATDLIQKCAVRVYKGKHEGSASLGIEKIKLNGRPHKFKGSRSYAYHSPIEVFIGNTTYNNRANLIAYLAGVMPTLELANVVRKD